MNNNFTISDIVKILNSLQRVDVDSGSDFQLGHTIVKSKDGELVYSDDIALAFGLDLRYVDGNLKFVEKNND